MIVPAGTGQTVTSAAWSPDASRVAYGYFHRRPGDQTFVSEIYVAGADGSDPGPLVERDRPGTVLDSPVWTPDGRHVYFSYTGVLSGRSVLQVQRVPSAGGEREVVVDNAYAPDLSPDGRALLFLRDERAGTSLWLLPLDGGQPRPLLPPDRYPGLAVPRFSPDGRRIAVAVLNSLSADSRPPRLLGWLLPPPAYAHGLPWDIWTFDADGGDPRRLTQINADDPSAAWSPDGRYIAIWGGNGLFLVSADGADLRQLSDRGGYGAPDWAP